MDWEKLFGIPNNCIKQCSYNIMGFLKDLDTFQAALLMKFGRDPINPWKKYKKKRKVYKPKRTLFSMSEKKRCPGCDSRLTYYRIKNKETVCRRCGEVFPDQENKEEEDKEWQLTW